MSTDISQIRHKFRIGLNLRLVLGLVPRLVLTRTLDLSLNLPLMAAPESVAECCR